MKYTLEITGDKELIDSLQWLKNNLDSGSEDLLDDAASRVRVDLANSAPKTTGELAGSMEILSSSYGERIIGAGQGRLGSRFPPSEYIKYVEHGGGPRNTLPNVDDIRLRFGLSEQAAWAMAAKIRNLGRAVRQPTHFVKNTAEVFETNFRQMTERWVDRLIAVSRF